MNLTVVLSDEQVDAIARRAAEIVGGEFETLDAGDESPYMTVAEAAAYLRCARQRIYDLAARVG